MSMRGAVSFAVVGAVVGGVAVLREQPEIVPEPESSSALATPAQGPSCAPLVLYDTHGSSDEADWSIVTQTGYRPEHVRDLIIDNGVVRASYEHLNDQQEGSHTLRLWTGAEWHRVTSNWYGDYTYWVSTIHEPAIDAVVSRNEAGAIEVSYEFDHYPEYLVPHVQLVKRVALQPCAPGMFVKFESTPRNPWGEREFGIGDLAPLSFSERAVGLHPVAREHVNLGLLHDDPLTWAAALGEDDVLRVLTLGRPMLALSYQFDWAHQGRVIVNKFDEAEGDVEYQAFLGAVPFDDAGSLIEAEDGYGWITQDASVSGGAFATVGFQNHTLLQVDVPSDGTYALWARSRASVGSELRIELGDVSVVVMNRVSSTFQMEPLIELELQEGAYQLKVTSLSATTDFDAFTLVPIGRAREVAQQGADLLGG